MRAPSSLGNRGRALWVSVAKALPEDWEFDERERAILAMAARQADDLERLDNAIEQHGAMTTGSTGQLVVNPAVIEARQARLAINRLLGELSLPDEDEQPRTSAGLRAQKAAATRWDRASQRDQRGYGRRGA
jgi:phage terminase small subunit